MSKPDSFRNRRTWTVIPTAALVASGLFPWQARAALVPSQDGITVYDTVNNVTWLANFNFPATNTFGLPICTGPGTQTCVNASGSMRYTSAAAWVSAMNAVNYLGHNNWQLPTTPPNDSGCGRTGPTGDNFGFGCAASAFGYLWNTLGLKAPNTSVPIPGNAVGPFSNFQPYLYWSQSGAPPPAGNFTFSFATGWQGANTQPNLLYALPMIPGKLPGTPPSLGHSLQVNPGGLTVYDPETDITWLANANLAASNTFGIPICADPTTPARCVAADGAMTFASASQFIANLNSAAYLGQTNWQLPTIDSSCPGYNCTGNQNPMGDLFYNQLGFSQGMTAVAAPNIAVGPFHNIQPYLYWTCGAATIQAGCNANGPAPNFEWSFSFGSGFEGTDLLANDLYVTAYFVGSPANICTYALSSGGQAFAAAGGGGSVAIATEQGCPWSVSGAPIWVSNTTSGSGNGTLAFQVVANAGADRSATISIEGLTFTIEQEAASIPGLSLVGSMPHLAAEENWTTAFTLVNKSGVPTTARLSFLGDDNSYSLDPNGKDLTLPLAFPQENAASGPLLAASFDRTLAANASLIVDSAGAQSAPVLIGSAQLAATGAVDGFAIFHQILTTQEAVVPLETRNARSYLLPFDNTEKLVLGVALANTSAQPVSVQLLIRDDSGAPIALPPVQQSLQLAAGDHYQFGLAAQFPATANMRGTIEFDTPQNGQISVLGLRFTPPNNALTTIPALANVGTGGGSFAHLASGDGWETTFVLVNVGTSAAQFTLNFYADQTGLPQQLPLLFPQPGGGTNTTAPSVTQILPAGATRLIVSSGTGQLITGSAQLITAGNVSGFVIFRHNSQEAVVPLESRNANAYIIAFDNTKGTATGIAVNAISTQQVNIPVTVRDDTGKQIGATDMILLNPNGHTQFTLVTDKYPATAHIRGTIEFDKPVNAQIGALGIRIPPTLTYTTLPALAK